MERGVLLRQQEGKLKGVLVSIHEVSHRVTVSIQEQDPIQDVSVSLPAPMMKNTLSEPGTQR